MLMSRGLPRRRTQGQWIPWLLGLLMAWATGVSSQTGFILDAPRTYTLFSSDISVTCGIPSTTTLPDARLILVDLHHHNISLSSPILYPEQELKIRCGLLDHPGQYVFRIIQSEGGITLMESAIMRADYPDFMLTWPWRLKALEEDVILQVTTPEPICDVVNSYRRIFIDVVYFGRNDTSLGLTLEQMLAIHPKQNIQRHEITRLSQLQDFSMTWLCPLFDQAGLYQVEFVSNYDPAIPMASSNIMLVEWSDVYGLEYREQSIFPCYRYVTMSYTQPRCAGSDDKIRMFRLIHVAESSLASPTNLEYVMEARVDVGASVVTFDCSYFHEAYPGYCFKYVSVAQSSRAVTEQATLCIPTTDQPVVDGGWSDWASWSACSVTCGSGTRSRYRACDSPTPTWGGDFCDGNTVEWRDCQPPCHRPSTAAPLGGFTISRDCQCGCLMTEPEGRIVATTQCPGSTIWQIRVADGKLVQLVFQVFTLSAQNHDTWVKVRDGGTQYSTLLLNQMGGHIPNAVRSTGQQMMVEFLAPYDQSGSGYVQNTEGFVALYSAVDPGGVLPTAPGPQDAEDDWLLPVTMVGIGFCIVVVILAVAFILHHRYMCREERRKAAPVSESLLVNGELPNSPTHSQHSLQGSQNISFSDPPSNSPQKRDYVMATGVTAHPVDGAARRGRHKKSPSQGPYEVESPRMASRHSSSSTLHKELPSPYQANASDSDFLYGPGQFADERHRHRRSRHLQSPSEPSNMGTVGSPGSSQPPSMAGRDPYHIHPHRTNGGVPLADEEDLSPSSPSSPLPPHHRSPARHAASAEAIPMNSYGGKQRRDYGTADTHLNSPRKERPGSREVRPPVEGRDSLHRRSNPLSPDHLKHHQGIANAVKNGVRSPVGSKPHVKPLPLRSIQRPDGQSPENGAQDPDATPTTAHSPSLGGLSPILQKASLFPDATSRTPSEMGSQADGFEYDDYIPDLPGSYFSMDPSAYTLTWSQQPSWAGKANHSGHKESQA